MDAEFAWYVILHVRDYVKSDAARTPPLPKVTDMNPITDVEILEAARSAYQDRYYGSDYVLWCEACGDDASSHLMESGCVCRRCAQDMLAHGAMHNED
jgi:hypothetical protein